MALTHDQSVSDNRAAIATSKESKGRVAILTADQVEDVEFFYPYYRFAEAGYEVDVLTPTGEPFSGYKGLGLSTGIDAVADASPHDYDALFIPGGLAPGEIRQHQPSLDFVRKFVATGRPVGAVCHGPQVLISAGLAEGRRMTSWREVASEVRHAGGIYEDSPIVEDGQLITARKPGDMPAQMRRLLERLAGEHAATGSVGVPEMTGDHTHA